jgi:uncharacterized protein (TIGR02145 family)
MPLNDGVIQKYCYNNNPLDCDIYGGLYNWHELMQYNYQSAGKGICPEGWHVPADSDWQTLMDTLGDWQIGASKVTETGTLHWSPPNTNATNESGFTGLPGGFLDLAAHDDFFSLHSGAFFSSSSSENRFGALYNSYFYLQNRILVGGSSVRCIKNSN